MHLTAGPLAMMNLQAQIEGIELRIAADAAVVDDRTKLIELIALRGQICSRIADYESADAMAQQLTRDEPTDARAFVARAQARSIFHRFTEALEDLDAADDLGASESLTKAERASVFQAIGRYDEAHALFDEIAKRRADFQSLAALATLHAVCDEIAAAEELFERCLASYRGISPIPPALLTFQRGHMWLAEGNLDRARRWFETTIEWLPAYAAAQSHLAEIDATLGRTEAAIARVLPLATASDDPQYAALLAHMLEHAGRSEEAERWRTKSAARYDELMAHYPEAFAHHVR
ncbi:MAG TPA: tetratricopeptide repeat protein [Candidatus Aquilonibacter sp.]